MRALLFASLLPITACADFPALDGTVSSAARDAPFPTLIDIRPLVATAQAGNEPPASLDSRITALQARAAALRASDVIASSDSDRLATGVGTTALR